MTGEYTVGSVEVKLFTYILLAWLGAVIIVVVLTQVAVNPSDCKRYPAGPIGINVVLLEVLCINMLPVNPPAMLVAVKKFAPLSPFGPCGPLGPCGPDVPIGPVAPAGPLDPLGP
jgi:hypothetical protein